jgi:hypothetical protein
VLFVILTQIFTLTLIQAGDPVGWTQIVEFGPTAVLLAMILIFLVRLAPTWKEIKLKELEMRGEENVVKGQQASALNGLAEALKEIAVVQRQGTETIQILQRANAQDTDRLATNVSIVSQRLESVEQRVSTITPHPQVATAESRAS